MKDELDALAAKAQACLATNPGLWRTQGGGAGGVEIHCTSAPEIATYLASVPPSVVLALVAYAEAATAVERGAEEGLIPRERWEELRSARITLAATLQRPKEP